ncbi:MAG: TraB/GumN family protein, partial [Xanthomonadales bacterium]|nr:TraB/GumN family protein [Xanthomonadales bacterium]
SPPMSEPIQKLTLGDTHLTLLGTAHVSRASADAVTRELNEGDYDAVAVELCPSRYAAIVDPDAMARMDLFQVLREGKGTMVIASLALGAYQQRLAEQFGIEPGAEMRAAVDHALEHHKPVWLIDREVGTTLKRVYRGMPWWRRFELLSSLLASVVSKEEVREDEIERIKDGDMLESAF